MSIRTRLAASSCTLSRSTRLDRRTQRLNFRDQHVNDNPYAAPQAELLAETRRRFHWQSALAAATMAFLTIPLWIALISLGNGKGVPDFLLAPGFIGTLALVSVLVACLLEMAKFRKRLYFPLTTVATMVLVAGAAFMLHAITR